MGDIADMILEGDDDGWVGYQKDLAARPRGPGKCPECGGETCLRTGKFGKFYGCSTFLKCHETRSY